ncbi:MAG: hypothetical protein WCI79_03190 [Candidatus Saccharibacteria bacterium]
MQDLDFDELDKAVSSLMPPSEPSDAASAQPTVTPAVPSPAPVVNVVVPTTPVVDSAPRPATGRFMDVVHPSSDMRSTLNMPQRPATPVPAPVVVAPPVRPAPVTPITPSPSVPNPAPAISNWSGAVDYQSPNPAPESPFLSGAKVEKRPLGAFSDDIPTPAVEPEPVVETAPVEPAEPEMPENTGNRSDLPDELDTSLLKVESDSSTNPSGIGASSDPFVQSTGATSINQQYTEKPASVEQTAGSIYDTSSYNKVAKNQPKKKSGWMWVLWIVLLLIVGAGAGVAFYYFAMPNLPGLKLPF